jgi:hypothetical protein
MNRSVFACLALALSVAAAARPVVIEESATISAPLPAEFTDFGAEVATNGEYALVNGFRIERTGGDEIWHYGALLFRRVKGAWNFDRVLERYDHPYDSYGYPVSFAMKGSLAAVEIARGFHLYELTSSGWTPTATGVGGDNAADLETDGTRVLAGIETWNGRVVERNASDAWTSQHLQGQPRGSDDEFWGGPVDIDGTHAVLGTPYTEDLEPQEVPVYERGASGWQLLDKIQVPDGVWRLGGEVVVRGNDVIVDHRTGPYVWQIPNLREQPVSRIQALDAYALRGMDEDLLAKSGEYVFILKRSADLGTVIQVFRPQTGTSNYQHVATLVTKNGTEIGGSFDVAGRTVIAGGNGLVHVWDLPDTFASTPAPRYDDFESGNGASWTQGAGAQYAAVQANASNGSPNRVFRQASDVGDAQAVLTGTVWTDQAIEADIKPTYFKSNDRWAGLATRYANAQNYYYVTLRNSGSVQLKRMTEGAITTLASAPLTVVAFHTYRVRLESIGTAHRVYVDGRLVASATDATGPKTGSPALVTYQTRADYDNVVASPSPRTTMFANDFSSEATGEWTIDALGQWNRTNNGTFAQNSIGGDARATIGMPTNDQVVSARMRATAFAPASGTQERWFGLMARYTNSSNYYYVTLRSGNTLQLRRMQNGAITALGSVPLTVTTGTWYSVRLDAVGDMLRLWVNGAQVLQVRDAAHPSGVPGLVTYKTAAEYDNFLAYQP